MNYEQFTHTIDNKKKIFLVDMRKEVNYHFSRIGKRWDNKIYKT